MSERLKEWREWGTFIVSVTAAVAIPLGVLILRKERLEIEANTRDHYVRQEDYAKETAKLEGTDAELWRKAGETNGKLDSLYVQSATISQTLSDLKEEVRALRK